MHTSYDEAVEELSPPGGLYAHSLPSHDCEGPDCSRSTNRASGWDGPFCSLRCKRQWQRENLGRAID